MTTLVVGPLILRKMFPPGSCAESSLGHLQTAEIISPLCRSGKVKIKDLRVCTKTLPLLLTPEIEFRACTAPCDVLA
jgi:hypothetical protein